MKKPILIVFALVFSLSAFSQIDSTSHHARELLEVTGSGSVGVQMMNNVMTTFRKEFPNVPNEFWQELSKEINGKDLVELVVPIYIKYYTDEELVKLIEFYRSPLGQKVIQRLPNISQDSYYVGQEWGKKIGGKVVARLKERGYFEDN